MKALIKQFGPTLEKLRENPVLMGKEHEENGCCELIGIIGAGGERGTTSAGFDCVYACMHEGKLLVSSSRRRNV